MPLQVDHARPVRTVDTRGNVVATETNAAAPMKVIDSVGRAVQADAAKVAEQAAAANPEVAKSEADAAEGEKAAEAKPSEAAIRKEWLEAQRERRKAGEFLKMAKAKLADAEGYEKARSLTESGEDPTALVRFAKLDPIKHYQDTTKFALSEKGKQVEDPVQRELREHKERLDQYAKEKNELQAKLQEREDLAAHNQVITERVIPLLRENAEQYESLLTEYGSNAAVEIYRTVWDIYQKTGTARSFKEVADEMEAYWTETIDKGIQAAAKLKKFQGRFAQSDTSHTPAAPETPKRSVTLSNRPSAAQSPVSAAPAARRSMTRDERVAEILRKFPD